MGKRNFYIFFAYTILFVGSAYAQSSFSDHESYIESHPDFKSVVFRKDSILDYQLVSYYYSIKANISNSSSSAYLCDHPQPIDYIFFALNYPSDFFILKEHQYERFTYIETQGNYRGNKILHYSQSYYKAVGDLGTGVGPIDPTDAYEISEHRAEELIELGIDKDAKIIPLADGKNGLWFNHMTYSIEPFDSVYNSAIRIVKIFFVPDNDKAKTSPYIPDPSPELYDQIGFQSTSYKLYPKNESTSDPSLVQFIQQLKAAVKAKDTLKLFECLDPYIVIHFNKRTYGIPEFSEAWRLHEKNSKLWDHLALILRLGGEWEYPKDPVYYIIPYLLPEEPYYHFSHRFNWHTTAVCISKQTKVYLEPKTKSKTTNTLSYDIVEIDTNFISTDFFKIKTINTNVHGFIEKGKVLRCDTHSIGIRKVDGFWKVVDFAPPYEND